MVDDRQHSEADQIKDFWALLKPRVMYLVVFTGAVGMWLAPGKVHPFIACLAVICIALGSGAAGAINMWYERHLDAKMARTKHRPLPKGRMLPSTAIEFSVIMAVASVIIMMVAVNMVAAFLLLVAILFYVFIYTIWLKPRSVQNIVIGGAAGAFPPMIGWAAVTGDVSVESVVLFVIIFMWTPPHFWALSLYRSDDYARVGIPMLPVVKGRQSTLKHIFWYSIALVWVSFLPVMIGMLGLVYGVTALLLGMRFVLLALRLYQEYQESKARALFGYSIVYLFVLFVAMVVDRVVLA